MVEIINREITTSDLKSVVGKLKSETIGADIEKHASVCHTHTLCGRINITPFTGHLPPAERLRPQGQGPQEAQVRQFVAVFVFAAW